MDRGKQIKQHLTPNTTYYFTQHPAQYFTW